MSAKATKAKIKCLACKIRPCDVVDTIDLDVSLDPFDGLHAPKGISKQLIGEYMASITPNWKGILLSNKNKRICICVSHFSEEHWIRDQR